MDGKNSKTYTMYISYKAIAKCVIPRRESFFYSLLGIYLYHRHFKLPFITFLFNAGCCPSVCVLCHLPLEIIVFSFIPETTGPS